MTSPAYAFPETLSPLRSWLDRHHVDVDAIKSDRQALHFAAKLSRRRVHWPRRGKSCFPELKRLQGALCGRVRHKTPETAEPASPVRSVPDSVWQDVAPRYGATGGQI